MLTALSLIGQAGLVTRTSKAQKLRAVRFVAFFMPSRQLWRVVYGEAARPAGLLAPVYRPDTSSAALSLVTPVGGLNHQQGVQS